VEHAVVRGIEDPLGGASGGLILVEHAEIHPPPSARQKTLHRAPTALPIMGKKLGTQVRTQEPKPAALIEIVVSLLRSVRPGRARAEGEGEYQMTSKKWDDPQLDAAQFAIDRFMSAQQTVGEQMAELRQRILEGRGTDEDRKQMKALTERYIALSKEVEDVGGRLLAGKHLPHPKLV
jgi:hypothetical protein